MYTTALALIFCYRELRHLSEGLDGVALERGRPIAGLRHQGFSNVEMIQYFEGHLDIIDGKNQSMLAFGANYLAVIGGAFYFTSLPQSSPQLLWMVYLTIGLVAIALLISFFIINRVQWQDHHSIRENDTSDQYTNDIVLELMQAVNARTKSFRASRLFYILSFGIAADTLLMHHQIGFFSWFAYTKWMMQPLISAGPLAS
jgi:hypothetical protein